MAFGLVAMMLLMTACGKGKKASVVERKDKTLYVASINKGYGIAWLEALLEEFCEQKGWDYVLYPVYTDSMLTQKIEAGAMACNYDLVFAGTGSIADKEFLLDLSDVLDSTIETGDRAGKKISECLDPTVYAGMGSKETGYYRMPWTGGVNGLLINNAAIEGVLGKDWKSKYPCRTTDELLDFCAALKNAGLAPFIHSANTNYYSFLYEAWFAQYNGLQGLSDYFNAYYTDYLGDKVRGYQVARNEGVLEAAKVMESIFGNGYSHESSNSIDWEVTQTYFMSGKAAMFSNGDWNNIEMMKQFPDNDVRFMQLPIVSALGTKLGITEEQLRQLVDYVDGKGEKPAVSSSNYSEEEIITAVKEARSFAASYADAHNVFIPEYSANADMAQEFLKFMASDEGQHIFSEKTGGLTMCYGYDLAKDEIYDSLSEFAKSRWEVADDVSLYVTDRSESYARAGLSPFRARGLAPLEVLMSRTDDRYTAQMVYDYDYESIKGEWSLIQSKVTKK